MKSTAEPDPLLIQGTATPLPSFPAITSPNSTTFTVGTPGTFTVTTTGFTPPTLTETGAPAVVRFVNNGNGTATLAGTPATGTAGTYPLTITATNSVSSATQSFTLTVAAPAVAAPTVTGLSPNSGPAGTLVTIFGTNLAGATGVLFGTTAATSFTVVTANEITATSPAGTAGSTVNVTVTTPSGTSATSAADQFTYT